eukprot:jgi/Chlat1/1214/Chrsp115S00745
MFRNAVAFHTYAPTSPTLSTTPLSSPTPTPTNSSPSSQDLNGTYMRNGPGKFEVGTDRVVHPFDGDGLVASFSLQNSRAYFRCRYVRTAGYEAELAAGKVLFRNSFGTQRKGGFAANLFDVSQKNVANTNVVAWGGKCLALWEAMQPHGLDPYTLETYGVETLGGILHEGLPFSTGVEFLDKYGKGLGGDPLSAHPHVDHATNRLVTFGSKFVSARNLTHGPVDTNVTFYEFNDKFGLAHKRELRIPGFAFAHDFCFTENYYLLYQAPVRYDPLPFVFGLKGPAECLKFLPNRPCKVHLIPRPDGKYKDKAPMVIDAGSCFVFHHANAFEQEDGTIIVDSIVLPTLNDFGMIASSDYLDIDWATVPENRLWRHRIDVNKKEVTARQMSKRIVEFPTINGAAFGKKHRYIYCGASRHPTRNQPFGTWVKFDVDTGATSEFSLGRSHFFQEPEFVSRANPTSEDDGWLMGLVYDSIEDRTDLVILDAKDMEAGPVATCHLKHHVPYGLHGNYVGEYYGPEQ